MYQPSMDELDRSFAELASEFDDVHLFRPSSFLCDDDGVCGPHLPGTDVRAYIDSNHLSDIASFSLWPGLCQSIYQ